MDRRKLPHAPADILVPLLRGGSARNAEGVRITRTRSTIGTIDNPTSSKHYSP